MTLTDGAEVYICLILTIEFGYDYWWNSRENRIKRRKNAEKKVKATIKEMDKPGLREGKGVLLQETGREVCDMREAPKPVQEEIKP